MSINSDSIISFIQNTFTDTGKSNAVIAVSGGIDSAVSFALTVKALGRDHVHAYYLPSKSSNPQNLKDIHALTSHFYTIPIGSIIQKSWRVIGRYMKYKSMESMESNASDTFHTSTTSHTSDTMRLANLSARIRMMIIYDQAKKHDALVIGTENYSEHLLGYFTRFGDEASDIEPIRHLYKTDVIALAKTLDIPQSIIDKSPSADLWHGQTDEKELGFSYIQADPILKLIVQQKTKEEIITAGFDPALTEAVLNRVNSASFKHRVPYAI